MERKLFVTFEQPEEVKGRLTVYVDKAKVCTLENHEVYEGAPLSSGKHVIRAVFGPSVYLLPFLRRNVINAEHAAGVWTVNKKVIPPGGSDWTLAFTFTAPKKGVPGKADFDFREKLQPKKETPQDDHTEGYRFRGPFVTDTGRDLVSRLYPPAFTGDTKYVKALELPYTLIGFISCGAMGGQRDLEFGWEYLCENPAGIPVLVRESFNVSADTTRPSGISRKHLSCIEVEKLTKAKEAECRKHMMPADRPSGCRYPFSPGSGTTLFSTNCIHSPMEKIYRKVKAIAGKSASPGMRSTLQIPAARSVMNWMRG